MLYSLEESGRLLVQACAMSFGYVFTPGALHEIHNMIRSGIGRMSDKGEESDPDKIFEAQRNLVEFVSKVAADARANNMTELDIHTVSSVLKDFCPVFPFS